MKIASKGKVKKSVDAYKKHVRGKNKAGNSNPRQAHMELVVKNKVAVTLGDVIYYVNTGESKSTGDLKTITDKETKAKTIELNCIMISREEMEKNPDMTTDDYNVARYIHAFNKRIRPLLVCFSKDIREQQVEVTKGVNKGTFKTIDNILVEVVKIKDKDTKKISMILESRKEFTEKECELIAGEPYNEEDQDSYEALMTMDDKEIRFWTSVNKLPNFMEQDEWDTIVVDYTERLRIARLEGIQEEKDRLDVIFQTLEVKDLSDISIYGTLPVMVEIISELHQDEETSVYYLKSRKWDTTLCEFDDMWKYEDTAKERAEYYNKVGNGSSDDRFEQWLDHKAEEEFMNGISGATEFNVWPMLERKAVEVSPELEDKLAAEDVIPEDLDPETLAQLEVEISEEDDGFDF
jgi:hypothetical protein